MTQTAVTQTHAGFKWDLMIPSNIDTEIHEGRDWEPCVSNWIRGRLKAGDVAIDVGANIGWFTLLMSKCVGDGGKVHAFEPEPSFRERLHRHLAMNQIENVQLHRCGLSDQSEQGWITKNVGPYFSSATMQRTYPTHEDCKQVQCFKLDEILVTDRLAMIKIDVDGYEMQVLRGAQGTIQRFGPMIIMEVADAAPAQFLEEMGYELWRGHGAVQTRAITVGDVANIINDTMPTINIFGVRK